MKVTIERRLNKAGDRELIRLVYWYGSYKDDEGKTKHRRKREVLDQFLYANPQSRLEKQHNKETLQLVEAIKSKRIAEAASGKHGFTLDKPDDIGFFELLDTMAADRGTSGGKSNHKLWQGARLQLLNIWDEGLLLRDVSEKMLLDCRTFLESKATTKTGKALKPATSSAYFGKVRAVMQRAYHKGYIERDITYDIKSIRVGDNERVYLSIDEVRRLVQTPCRYDVLKRAFLFSCLTGLRWSDCFKLEWSEVSDLDGHPRITFKQKKTKGLQYLDISPKAYGLLGERGEGRVFQGLRYSAHANIALLQWALAAGIDKHVTFHAARHTFAVSLLSNGVEIFTVSKLLGHSQVKTTQIYADVIDTVRREAMHRVPDIGL